MKKTISLITFAIFMCMLTPHITSCTLDNKNNTEDTTVNIDFTETQTAVTTTAPIVYPAEAKTPAVLRENVKFLGRTYDSNDAVYFNWSLSGFEFKFNGTGAEAVILTGLGKDGTSLANNAILYVYIDGSEEHTSQLDLDEKRKTYTLAEGLEPGEHTVKVVKRTDVSYSDAALAELTIKDGTYCEKPAASSRKIEFIGDSYTSGDGCYVISGQPKYTSILQDATITFANIVGKHYNADINLISRCGLGLIWHSSGKTPETGGVSLPMIYEKTDYYYYSTENMWDFSEFAPDLIVLNIGTNDRKHVAISSTIERWISTYVDMLKTIRKNNPNAQILCVLGAVNADKVEMKFTEIQERLEAEQLTGITFYTFDKTVYDKAVDGVGEGNHPTPASHKKTADQLIEQINKIMNWQ